MSNPTGNGGFRPGISGNPGGKRPGNHNRDVKWLARRHTKECVAALVEIGLDPKVRPGDRIIALNSILDRGFGKPHTSIDLDVVLSKRLAELSLDEARALEKMLAEAAPALLIDATSEAIE